MNMFVGSTVYTWLYTWLCTFGVIMSERFPVMEDAKALSDRLMKNYGKHILPSETGGPFNVTIYVSLRAVGEIDEISEKLSTAISFYYRWNDARIRWNQSNRNIDWVTLGWNDVWKPILRVSNPHAHDYRRQSVDRSYETVIYDSTGTAFFDEMMIITSTCDLDMTYYPFDTQSCDIEMYIVGYNEYWFNLDVSVHKGFDVSDAHHGSWNLLSKHVISKDGGTFTIQLVFERRPLFVLLNLLLPIIVLAMLTPIVFVLPKKSGERVGYAITMLLAISVYMTIVSDQLPQNSEPMPLVSIMTFIWYTLDALIVFIVISNTKVYAMNDSKPMPYVLRQFVLLTRKMTCHRRMKAEIDGLPEERHKHHEVTSLNGEDEANKRNDMPQDLDERDVSDNISWQELSHSIDKWCFVISYFLKISLPVFLISISELKSHN